MAQLSLFNAPEVPYLPESDRELVIHRPSRSLLIAQLQLELGQTQAEITAIYEAADSNPYYNKERRLPPLRQKVQELENRISALQRALTTC